MRGRRGQRLLAHAPQHRRFRSGRNRQPAGQPVGKLVIRHLQQRLNRGNFRIVKSGYVTLHETTEQEVVLVRAAMRGAIQQTATPHIEGGCFWFSHRLDVI